MKLTGLHMLITYQCTFACDHCFAWGSPQQSGTMTLPLIREILCQAQELGTVKTIYFEGGEPGLYYATLLGGVRMAVETGFQAGIVTNAYWATSREDAQAWLQPFAGLLHDLTVSSDLFHYSETQSKQAQFAGAAAKEANIPIGVISIARPESSAATASGQLPSGESGVMYRGRAAVKLAQNAPARPWSGFTTCPHERLGDPGRVHVDPLGNLHVCQGISLGNLLHTPLTDICAAYDAAAHPIVGPLLDGGPAELARRYQFSPQAGYADACHLCYEARRSLRPRFPDILTPDQMYGAPGE